MQRIRYKNRDDAARALADALAGHAWADPVVVGIPRGGVPMAAIVAKELGAALDVVLVHKLRAPGHPEYAIGSVDETGHVSLNDETRGSADEPAIREEIDTEIATLSARRQRYGAPRQPLAARDVIIVDDGAATGATVKAAIQAIRDKGAASVSVALGVAAPEVVRALDALAERVICPIQPPGFMAVSQAYDAFDQVSDTEVERILAG